MRLIDADALLEVIAEQERWNVPDFVYESIKNAPTIEVALIVGGKLSNEKTEDIVKCKNCVYFANIHLKQDGTEDKRYKADFCEYHRGYTRENHFCSNAIGVKETKNEID